jgi:alpha-D-ribose 1-methylphosphonate 5-triphosphate synthase subunit PhnH
LPGRHRAAVAVCLALVDLETLWLDAQAACRRCWAVCAALRLPDRRGARGRTALVVDARSMPPLDAFDGGSDEYPDRSTTLIVQATALTAGAGKRLTGPGIAGEARLAVEGVPERFWAELRDNHARVPRGVDVILAAPAGVAALPRTTRVED